MELWELLITLNKAPLSCILKSETKLFVKLERNNYETTVLVCCLSGSNV